MTELSDLLAACAAVQADPKAAGSTKKMAGALKAWAPTVEPPAPPSPTYLFHDEFDGAAGAPPDPAKWVNVDGTHYGGVGYAKATNAFQDGRGSLILRITRETSPWYGRHFAGAMLGTYQYGSGWPPTKLLASFPVPCRYEARFLLPAVNGAWCGAGWLQNVDRTNAQGLAELDCGECRATFPTVVGFSQHLWVNGTDTKTENASVSMQDGRVTWHTVAVEVRSTGTTYFLDGVKATTHSGVTGKLGLLLHNQLADATSWGAGGLQPDPSDPGPWDMKIDYVRVTAL